MLQLPRMLHVLFIALRLWLDLMCYELDQLWIGIRERVTTAGLARYMVLVMKMMMMILDVDMLLRVMLHVRLGPTLVSI